MADLEVVMADYCTLSELKQALRITDQMDDSLLASSVDAASRWIDGYCQRTFVRAGTAATARDFVPSGRMDVLVIDDAVQVTQVAIDDDLDGTFGEVLSTEDYQLEPVGQRAGGLTIPFNRIRPLEDGYWPLDLPSGRATVRVTGRWGWSATPDAVNTACILQAARLYTRFASPVGVVSFGDMGAIRVSRFVDPDVEALLGPYRRVRF